MKKFFLLIVIIALAATGGMFYWLNQPKFMIGKRENVTKMIITYGIGEEGETYVITEKNEMKEIWDILAKTKDLEINKYPQHAESVQWDPQFRIIIEYSNGAQQMYASSYNYEKLVRNTAKYGIHPFYSDVSFSNIDKEVHSINQDT